MQICNVLGFQRTRYISRIAIVGSYFDLQETDNLSYRVPIAFYIPNKKMNEGSYCCTSLALVDVIGLLNFSHSSPYVVYV